MNYSITHKTTYDYGDVVPECFNIVRLAPVSYTHLTLPTIHLV